MADLPLEQPPPGVAPVLPPPIDRKSLWLSLLLPSGATLLVTGGFALSAMGGSGNLAGPSLPLLLLTGPVVALLALVWFLRTLRVRFRGGSLVLLAFAYLFGQAVLILVLLFCCCLALATTGSIH